MIQLIFVIALSTMIVACVFFFFKEADGSTKWKAVKTMLY